ncbi:non-ribosomal peptide synthetase [Crocosphaera sp.]|uniref:non-ribosomal peptide synthetase n=1 Tax=Crocosphaera sp. TaxID=2729996 RepID=UPI002614C9DB|nr:non-ribosomal peptide synthetase [Crocosphaera sp.]MDJ0579751.1 amino acid adenylation domain-containing protein [Crocosphaera sp.]
MSDIAEKSNLTTSQFMLWLGQKLAPTAPIYNMVLAFTINGEINSLLFQKVFQILINKSDILRTVIEEVNNIPQQKVQSTLNYTLPLLDFTAENNPEITAKKWIQEKCQQPFNLQERLFDSALIKIDSERFIWYLNQHHLITDIWSVSLIYRYMSDFYRQAVEDTLIDLSALPSYAEYINYENNSRDFSIYKKAVDYWQKKQDKLSKQIIFYGNNITNTQSRTKRVSYYLDKDGLSQNLRAITTEKEIRSLTVHLSLFNIFATVIFAYLYRISGQESLAIGTPAHNRPTKNFKETIGVFIEVFPFQICIEEGETFLSLLKKVQQESNGFLRYAQPGTSRFALNREINVILNYINASFPDFNGLEMQSDWVHAGYGDSRHHLRIQVHDLDKSGNFLLHFDFNNDLFDEALQQRAIAHFISLLKGFIEDRNQPIDKVNLVTAEEEKDIINHFSDIQSNFDDSKLEKNVIDIFEEQVNQTPNSPAISYNQQQITYDEFNKKVNQLARYLQKKGIGQEITVGIFMRRSLEMLIAIWAIIKAGGTYVPLDPNYPSERINFIVKDTQVSLILTEGSLGEEISVDSNLDIIDLDKDWIKIKDESSENLDKKIQPGDLAYIIYTSGSTGQPKGVMIEHRGLINYVSWAKQEYINNNDPNFKAKFPLFSPLSFDLTVTSIMVPLISGGEIIIYEENTEEIDLSIARIIEDNAVNIIKLTPSHLSIIKDLDLSQSQIKKMILGGEDLKTSLARKITEAFDNNIDIYNEYGPSEATVGCMIYKFDYQQDQGVSVPIGKPSAGSQIYVLDKYLNLVPQGVVGEIYIASPGLAKGYLNRPELSRERFISNPFKPGERLYKTGDLGRWKNNGQLQYLGRSDRQVKIRGTRIELGEVETVLLSHPKITDCVVDIVQKKASLDSKSSIIHCSQCGIPSNYPNITLDENGVCNLCNAYENYQHRIQQYFKPFDELKKILNEAKTNKRGEYDCLMLLSGGKDSTYVLYQLVGMGLKVLTFTLDNGYISEQAKGNIQRVVESLNVDHIFGNTPAMNKIFVDSLQRHCNVCNGCFKTIYTLSMQLADEKGIPVIITGLSRGQFFETRLTVELFTQPNFDVNEIDKMVLEARKAYHRVDDAIYRELDVTAFSDDEIFNRVKIVDFYRYCDVELEEMLRFLKENAPWIRPSDTGRSTNCLINNAGIYVHTQQQGYHNYALPYSWDVRLGHKERDTALEELNDNINVEDVERILQEIGYEEVENEDNKLVAYYVSSTHLSSADLRTYLSQKLPRNTIPSYFIPLDKIPLTNNGKLDRTCLPSPENTRPELDTTFVIPSQPLEKTLSQIWTTVLKVNQIGIYDNFFDLGGDSIMAIQIAIKANEFGLQLSPNQLFQHPTIKELADNIDTLSIILSEQGLVTGSVPLTPIQHRFFAQNVQEPNHWNQSLLLEIDEKLDNNLLEKALQQLLIHHDSLRSQFKKESFSWQQFIPESIPNVTVTSVDLSHKTVSEQDDSTAKIEENLQKSINLAQGELIKIALLNLGNNQKNHLLIIIHHLAIDGVSWSILLKDLQTLYQQLKNGQPCQLPLKTTSFKQWSEKLVELANLDNNLQTEIEYWQSLSGTELPSLSLDYDSTENTEATAKNITVSLTAEETNLLLQDIPKIHHTHINEILITALTLSITEITQNPLIQIDLEGHGREQEIVKGANLVRTIGWFTSIFPVIFKIENNKNLELSLTSIKEELSNIPNRGISYGILHYLRSDEILEAISPSKILFNYLGIMEQLLAENSPFKLCRELTLSRSDQEKRQYILEINAFIIEEKLTIDWRYSGNFNQEKIVKQMIDNFSKKLRSLITHCSQSQAEDSTPNDFPLANLTEDKINKIAKLLG